MASDACQAGELIGIPLAGAADPRAGEEENKIGDDVGIFCLEALGVLGG
jgi:hypothetical protein